MPSAVRLRADGGNNGIRVRSSGFLRFGGGAIAYPHAARIAAPLHNPRS